MNKPANFDDLYELARQVPLDEMEFTISLKPNDVLLIERLSVLYDIPGPLVLRLAIRKLAHWENVLDIS